MNTPGQLVIVDPAAEVRTASLSVAGRLASLEGTKLGMIDNSKHMALPMLKALEALLKRDFGVASFDYYLKDNASIPMPPDVVAKMATHCDAVIHGVGD
jgi:hypothetical protein